MLLNPIPSSQFDVHQMSIYVISLLGGGHLSIGKVPNSGLQTGSDGHPRARTVFLQSPHAGLLLFGQGMCQCVCVFISERLQHNGFEQ